MASGLQPPGPGWWWPWRCFQDPEAQFVVDRVEDEIAFALENGAVPPVEMRARVEQVLDLLDLVPLRERALETLSGGQKQRVAIAEA